MEFDEYIKKKIIDIIQNYNNQMDYEIQVHAKKSINIRKNFLLSQFQRINQIRKLDEQLKNKLSSIKQKMNEEIKKIKLNTLINNNIKNKKALLIGINYDNTNAQLNGCINDVSLIGDYIKTKGFSITLLTDKTEKKPTKTNILLELENFLSSSQENDILYFHYSGHGSYLNDTNNEELDGKDETIVSMDLKNIRDDELISLIKQNLPKNRTLIAIFDSCHSGTVLDLKYSLSELNNSILSNSKYDDMDSNIIMISGCRDSQTSEECLTSTGGDGLLTWSLYDTLTKNKNLTWISLYNSIKTLLKNKRTTQVPQLSMGSLINLNESIVI